MANLGKLSGTPWGIGYIKANDKRRHKSRCGYYENKACNYRHGRCIGSSHCSHYIERDEREVRLKILEEEVKRTRVRKAKKETLARNKKYKNILRKGRQVVHKKFGPGIIISNTSNIIKIDFKGKLRKFKLSFLLDKDLLKLI